MSETVTVWRPAAAGRDEYNNPVGGELAKVADLVADVAPKFAEEHDANRDARLLGFTLYFAEPSGVRAGDVVEVRGNRCPVDGSDAAGWAFTDGDFAGEVVTVRLVRG